MESICRRHNKCNLITEIPSGWVENIVGKGENAGYHNVFKMRLFPIKVPIAANQEGVCLQTTSKSYSYHLKIWHFL